MSDAKKWQARTGQKIEKLYAWVVTEPDGGEGIPAADIGSMAMPMVGADRERMESLREFAEHVHQVTGYPVKLKMFSGGTVIDEIG
jgi:hypothetical protein